MTNFTFGDTDFLLNGEPFRVLSGAIHYFRVHPDLWADRIQKARAMGLNTIETYVAWNAHEPKRGVWDVTGSNDLARFLDLVAEAGMHAIVRPGPYICAEWHNGGLPVWLTSIDGVGLRRSEPQYLAEVTRYLRQVYDIVAPRQIDRGGPVILVQIENEYGAYGSDKNYLRELVTVTRDSDITVPLTTIDQPTDAMLSDGSLPGVHLTASFGSRAVDRLATLREHQPTGPLMCAEFWDGWFDWWGSHHHVTSAEEAANELDALLGSGASVNFYMFHGGTNFGLTNGANHKGRYLPIATSYDYDAPLDEAGNPTEKYFAFRDVIARYAPVPAETPVVAPPAPAFEVALVVAGDWTPTVTAPEASARTSTSTSTNTSTPPTFEDLEQISALVLYEVDLPPMQRSELFEVDEVRDHAWVEVDGLPVGTLSRTLQQRSIVLPPGHTLTVLVEEQGRVNYAERIGEHKGLIGTPLLAGLPLEGWSATPIDVALLGQQADVAAPQSTPPYRASARSTLRGTFTLDASTDLFLDTSHWGKGYAFVNGFFLGRYWRTGPQQTLYVPGPVVRAGENSVVVVELERGTRDVARFVGTASLGHTEE
ncbi:beta-galactosidase [Glaciihabitans tibetensis]|uniref:Beta-galactosidase n=1 Tax=Glaciihabitans tibetensis TaxID=1266600 RepID=A0A2T0VDZ6_9MICO|nr:beta-galactosidase family protein [Glaciihabitans tibetensis]PRY68406.1 beta-galactosidase [Glaciihabitans tibetensis]